MSLILDKVNHIYNAGTTFERKALKDISLCIPDGQFIGIIGHTGSGKSTLIQHFNGLLKPSSGNIYFDGKDISDKEFSLKELRQKVGLVFQYPEYQLFETTVSKDAIFGPMNMGLPLLEAQLRAYEALKDVGIGEDLLDASPFDLSGGQKRRVAIAGVLAMRPEILVLDEPAAGLDPIGRREILSLIAKIRKERGITVILVSHSMDDVAEFVERLIVMDNGRIAMDDTPVEVFKQAERLQAMGLDLPQITKLCKRLKDEGVSVPESVLTIEDAALALKL